MRVPEVVSLIVCERLEVNPQARLLSAVGITHRPIFPNFPSPALPFTVYCGLYDGDGEGTMELAIVRLETEEQIYRYQRWFALPGCGRFLHMELPVRRCVFPAPGRYLIKLSLDRKFLAERLIEVARR
jgi:hypothetical protein